MKKSFLFFVLLSIFTGGKAWAAPSFDVPSENEVILWSGENQVFLSNVCDISSFDDVEVIKGAGLFEETPSIDYIPGRLFAILKIKEKGIAGTAKLKITANSESKELTIAIKPFKNPGIRLTVDAYVWNYPTGESAVTVYDKIVPSAEIPVWDNPFWGNHREDILSANGRPSSGLYSLTLKGFFIPPLTGEYVFRYTIPRECQGWVYLDTTCTSWKAAKLLIAIDNNVLPKSTASTESTATSEGLTLLAGKAYPLYSLQSFTNKSPVASTIKVSGPGIEEQIISGDMLAPVYDSLKPSAPENPSIVAVFDKSIIVGWDKSKKTEGKLVAIKGYNVYVNGAKKNDEPIKETTYKIENLSPGTKYDIFITAVDASGNESLVRDKMQGTKLYDIGTEEVIATGQGGVYPNPAGNTLYVKVPQAGDGKATVTIYNNAGVCLLSETTGMQTVELDISHLIPGNYFVTIEKGGKKESVPFIKK